MSAPYSCLVRVEGNRSFHVPYRSGITKDHGLTCDDAKSNQDALKDQPLSSLTTISPSLFLLISIIHPHRIVYRLGFPFIKYEPRHHGIHLNVRSFTKIKTSH